MEGGGGQPRFLPPDPGPEPEPGTPAAAEAPTEPLPQPPPPQQQWAPPQQQTWAPPQQQQWAPQQQTWAPPQQQWTPPPQQTPPPPGYGHPSPGWGQYPQQPQQQWYHSSEPDNGPAVAGFILAMIAFALLLPFGIGAILALPSAIAAMVFSRNGMRKVKAGETRKHAKLARAGWICGIIGVVLSILVLIATVVLLTDQGFQQDLEDYFDELEQQQRENQDGFTSAALVAGAVVRAGADLLT